MRRFLLGREDGRLDAAGSDAAALEELLLFRQILLLLWLLARREGLHRGRGRLGLRRQRSGRTVRVFLHLP